MNHKNTLLQIIDFIHQVGIDKPYCSLTLNYEPIIHSFNHTAFNEKDLKEQILSFPEEIKSYNLTIDNYGPYTENSYTNFYTITEMVFHSKGMLFSFISPFLINKHIKVSDMDMMVKIQQEHMDSAKKLYELITHNNNHYEKNELP
jgi:hypothetical protein